MGSGFTNDVMHAENGDFSGDFPVGQTGNILETNGQLWIGSTVATPGNTHIRVGKITSPLGTVSIGYSSPNITIDLAGGSTGIDSIGTQTGTNPIVPTGTGLVTINGAVVAAGTNPVRSDGTGPNTMAIEVQISQALAAADVTKIGLSNFDSAAFDVSATGFVQLNGGGIASTSFTVDANTAPGTNPVVPTAAGVVTIEAAAVAAHSVPIETRSRAANTFKVEVQEAAAVAATDATKSGISHFNSAQFTVDANGFVSSSGTGILNTLTGNSGGAISPTAGNINTLGTGSITIAGAGSTLTTQLTGLTNHAVLVGAGTATITNVGPTATVGQVLQSAGAAADPAFSTATYPLTTTVSQILYSSATNVVSGLATANRAVLTTGTTGIPVLTAIATDGQMIIGSTAGAPAAGTITSTGGTITVTTGSNTLNLEVASGGFVWSDTSGAFAAVKENGYFITTTATGTLPAAPAEGDTIKFIVDTTNLLTIQANTGQKIRIGTTLSAAAGTAINTQRGDAITLVYRTSGTTWFSEQNPVGGWNIT